MRRLLQAAALCVATSVLFADARPLLADSTAQSSVDEGFVVNRFDVTIDLGADARMRVTEEIEVTFFEERRGIFRVIPVDYPTGRGHDRRVQIDVVAVVDASGEPYQVETSRDGPDLNIRIGDPDVYLPAGTTKLYRIVYDAFGMINWFEESGGWSASAELYWNVTGDGWPTTIDSSSVVVRYPDVAAEAVRLRVFTGPYGSTRSDTASGPTPELDGANTGAQISLQGNQARVELDQPLQPYEGLTVVLQVPASAIEPPTLAERVWLLILANLGFTLPFWLLGAFALVWWRKGRDPHSRPMVVQYDPPDGMTGPEAGALLDERVDQRDLTAGIIALAVDGYLEIHPKEEGIVFNKRTADLKLTDKPKQAAMTKFQGDLYDRLAKVGTTITPEDLRTDVAPSIDSLRSALYESLVDRGYYARSPNSTKWIWFFVGLAGIVLLAALFTLISPTHNPLPAVIGGALALIPVAAFSRAMPQRTSAGARAHSEVLGFEEFIRRAHTDQLEWRSKVDPSAALYERLLPHAVAFGLVTQWTDAFADILMSAPGWYRTPAGHTFTPHDFGSDLNTVGDSIGAAAATPPRSAGASGGSSGFGGGGFSGGGFGGGGGGSW